MVFCFFKIKEIIGIGVLNGLIILFEMSIFLVVIILMGVFGMEIIVVY